MEIQVLPDALARSPGSVFSNPTPFGIVDAYPIFIQTPVRDQTEFYSGKF
jgi:hypothetical protein